MYKYFYLYCSITFFVAFSLRAQTIDSVIIKGRVADSLQQPVAWATVHIYKNDSLLATNATDEKGYFQFTTIKKLATTIHISATTYKDLVKNINWPETDSPISDFGTFFLLNKGNELENVTVTASKPLIKRETDKLVYNTDADPESKFSSVLEIMRKVPYLSVDGQENLTLKGNSSYRILINGKPSGLVDNDPKSFLKSLPASTIQSIEVYTTPPSKYDAEGLGGVINIVTNKKVGEGYKGNINLNGSTPAGGPGAGFSFTAAHKKLGVELYGGGNFSYTPPVSNATTRTTPNTRLDVSGDNKGNSNGRYIGTQFSYELDSLQLLTAQLNFNGFYSRGANHRVSLLQQQNEIREQFRQSGNSRGNNNGFDGGLNYQLGFKKDKSKLLTVSYRYMQYRTHHTMYNRFFDEINYPAIDFNQYNNTDYIEHTGQVDYLQNIKKLKVEAGMKTIFRNNSSAFSTAQYDDAIDQFLNHAGQQDGFENRQSILSAYNTYSFTLKSWGFKAGVRVEQTFNHIDFSSTSTPINNHYFNLVPSVVINKDNKNGSYLNLGYNQRLKRPGINRLNPFVNRTNPNFIEYGNPNLKASLMHSLDLGYGFNKKQSVNIGLTYAFTNNMDLKNSRYDTASKITYTTYENSGKVDALILNANFNLAVTKALRTIINGNVANFWIQTVTDNYIEETQRILFRASVSNTYAFNNDWLAGASVYVNGKNLAPAQIGTVNGYVSSNFSLSKNLLNKKLSLSAYINNPFTKYRNSRTEISSYNFTEINNSQEYFRRVGFSVNYKFGKLKEDIKRNKRGINNNDLAN
ncbi:TonB-dependent receptor [Niabella aquatica]